MGININLDIQKEQYLSSLFSLGELMKLGIGQDAWSCEKLKTILNRNKYLFKDNYLFDRNHPTKEYLPIADYKLLEETARTFHILGGSGSLKEWLFALSREKYDNPFVEIDTQKKLREQTQWWLLSIANLLRPLLNESDLDALDTKEYYIGCESKSELPIIEIKYSGDDWLYSIVEKLDWNSWMEDKIPDSSVVGIQKFLHLHTNSVSYTHLTLPTKRIV